METILTVLFTLIFALPCGFVAGVAHAKEMKENRNE